jgi:hypothetical protein
MFIKKLRPFYLAFLISLSSCLPYGLPEHPATFQTSVNPKNTTLHFTPTAGKRILFIAPEYHPNETEYFGSKYLLFFPITRLFLQHGTQNFVLEKSIEIFKNIGYQVFITDKKSAISSIQHIQPSFIIEPEFEDLKITVKDFFVIRKITISGSLIFKSFRYQKSNNSLVASNVFRKDIDENSYKRFGKGPYLSFLLEKEVGEKILEISKLLSSRPISNKLTPTESLVLINPPQINPDINPVQGQALADSYGFSSETPYQTIQIARLVQKGAFRAFNKLSPSIAQSLQPTNMRPRTNSSKLIFFDISLNELRFEGRNISLSAELRLMESAHENQQEILFLKNCSFTGTLTKSKDGRRVVSLEDAIEKFTIEFFQKNSNPLYCYSDPKTQTK